MRHTIPACALILAPLAAQTPVSTTLVASGFTKALCVTHAPLDPTRLFVVEKAGRIRVVQNGSVLPAPFLDVASIVNSSTLEFGMLGLCFDPSYATNGFFYVHYTSGPNGDSNFARYQVSADPNVADPGSRHSILFLPASTLHHRGGWIGFGGDGFLYLATGDGGPQEDPFNHAQDPTLLHGKILRIDPSADDFPSDPEQNYAIPATNPFVGQPGITPEIWALGLRNPWRCSFDRATSDLWIADVGEYEREEIDFQSAGVGGLNFGWRCHEGSVCTIWGGCTCDGPTLTPPAHDYGHALGRSVTGGYVYRGSAIPSLQGTYFYGDYQSGRFWSLRRNGSGISDLIERTAQFDPPGALAIEHPASFGEDANGELYVCDYTDGELYRMDPVPDLTAPVVTIQVPTNQAAASTYRDVLDFAGIATDDVGVTGVTWSNAQGGSGTASGTATWSVPDVALVLGTNVITVSATDGANSGGDVLTVTRFHAPVVYCTGDGSGTPCPCANVGDPGHGCPSSVQPAGARLRSTGFASLADDDLVLEGSSMPNGPALYIQGTIETNGGAGSVFGDGKRCAGGSLMRLATKLNVAGTSRYPEPADLSISQRGAIVAAPTTRTYQAWYRNAASFCNPETFNLTNGLSVLWSH